MHTHIQIDREIDRSTTIVCLLFGYPDTYKQAKNQRHAHRYTDLDSRADGRREGQKDDQKNRLSNGGLSVE